MYGEARWSGPSAMAAESDLLDLESLLAPRCMQFVLICLPQSRRDHPLNLSILISGGKETNQDSLSNGERTGRNSSAEARVPYGAPSAVAFGSARFPGRCRRVQVPLEWGHGPERVPGPCDLRARLPGGTLLRVGLLESAAQSRW